MLWSSHITYGGRETNSFEDKEMATEDVINYVEYNINPSIKINLNTQTQDNSRTWQNKVQKHN